MTPTPEFSVQELQALIPAIQDVHKEAYGYYPLKYAMEIIEWVSAEECDQDLEDTFFFFKDYLGDRHCNIINALAEKESWEDDPPTFAFIANNKNPLFFKFKTE